MTTRKSAIDLIATIRPDLATRTDDVVSEPERERLLHSITSAPLDRSAPAKRRRPVYRRPLVLGAFAAGAAALAMVTAVAIPSEPHEVGPSKPAGQVLDTSDVIKQLAAATAAEQNDVVYTHTVITPPGGAPGTGYVYDEWYRSDSGAARLVSTDPDGTICLDDMAININAQFPGPPPTSNAASTKITAVAHQNHTWWAWTQPRQLEWPVSPACASAPGDKDVIGWDYPAAYTSVLAPVFVFNADKDMLADGQAHLVGNGPVVDGQPTIMMSVGPYQSGVSGTELVNATTYQEVRDVTTSKQGARVQTDVRFLPPTAANLARLTLTVPAGYRQVTPQILYPVRKK